MLESEAKVKWCPMFNGAGDWDDNRWIGDRVLSLNENACCLGPRCVCWIDDGYNDKAGERSGRCWGAR